VHIPLRGSRGSGAIYSKLIYDERSQQWKPILLQLSISRLADGTQGTAQRYDMNIPDAYKMTTINGNALTRSSIAPTTSLSSTASTPSTQQPA